MTASIASRRSTASRTPPRHRVGGGTLLGVFIGIVVGLGMAATVAYWLMKNNPALPLPSLSRDTREAPRDAAKVAKADAEKPRFDFYKILPGVEEPKVQPERREPAQGDRVVVEQAKAVGKPGIVAAEAVQTRLPERVLPVDAAPKLAKAADRFWLQAGSFSTVPDAENLRARLALAGWEATVQEGALPDRSIRYRVRLGPYDNPDELGRMKTELARRGFDVAVIRY